MRKFHSFFFLLVLLAGFVTAKAEIVPLNKSGKTGTEVKLLSSSSTTSLVQFNINAYELISVTTPQGKQMIVSVDDGSLIMQKGAPDLAKITKSLLIPDMSEMQIEIVSSKYVDIQNVNVAPSKGNFTRDINPADVSFVYGKEYQRNRFFPSVLAQLNEPYIIRDFRASSFDVYPLQYNPTTKVLRVYTEITVKVSETGKTGTNVYDRKTAITSIDKEFSQIYSRQFLNFGEQSKYTALNEEGSMLIICHSAFMTTMQPFIDWKTKRGLTVEMVNVSTIGTTAAAIKTYVANYYNTHNLKYLLLVGDAAQIPTNQGGTLGGPSDNAYGYILGNDHYQEIFVGRFSAENIAQVQTQVQRSVEYEQNPNTTSNWLAKSIGVASDQGPGDDNEYDYQHIHAIQTQLLAYTYVTPSVELYDGSQGGNDAPGSPSATNVGTAINAGGGIINYTGHGSTTSWGTSGFSNSDVANLNNAGKLPFIWSVACVNGDFVSGTCFAEAWLRATKNNQPTGAVATMMSTINQSWNPPMIGQDEMVDILAESYQNNIKRTFGGISINGCFQMNEEAGSGGNEMTDTWTLFGDPSLLVRTAVPTDMTISHLPTVFIGMSEFVVNCDTEDATVCITSNGQILGIASVTAGVATISFPSLSDVGMLDITVTGYNKLPYTSQVEIIPAAGPYITLYSPATYINDTAGNSNGVADYNESIVLDLAVRNVGIDTSFDVNSTVSTTDSYITLTDSTFAYGNILAGDTVSSTDGFAFTIANNVPNQHKAIFTLTTTDLAGHAWANTFSITINAPVLSMSFVSINDELGNNNGKLDPGETVQINVKTTNTGNSTSFPAVCSIASISPNVSILENTFELEPISTDADATFWVSIDGAATAGSVATFDFAVVAGEYTAQLSVNKKIGLVAEDFESGDFSSYDWTFAGDENWIITNEEAFEGVFSAKSGTITHSQESQLQLTMNLPVADSVYFYVKTSSENGSSNNYDFLKFSISGVEKGRWDGETDWQMVQFLVPAGNKTLTWSYEKDGSVSSGSDAAWLDYVILPGNSGGGTNVAPEFTSTPIVQVGENEVYNYVVAASNPKPDSQLTFACPIKPEWLTLTNNNDGTANLTGSTSQLGVYQVVVTVTNGSASASQTFEVEVKNVGNQAPVFVTEPLLTVNEDVEYVYNINVADNDNDPITLDCIQKPDWMIFNYLTDGFAELRGTPTNENVGEYQVVLSITDGFIQEPVLQTFTISVTNVNDAPEFTSTPILEATEDIVYTYTIAAQDVDNATVTFTCANVPTWLTLTDNVDKTATLTGTPNDLSVGELNLVVDITDGELTAQQTFTIVIANVNDVPFFASEPVTEVVAKTEYVYEISATDDDVDATVTFVCDSLPEWLTLTDNHNGTAVLRGTPTGMQIGSYTFALEVTDSVISSPMVQHFTINVTEPAGVDYLTQSTPNFFVSPNPFAAQADVNFYLSNSSKVRMYLYNSQGRLIREMVQSQTMNAGLHRVRLNSCGLSCGVYVCVLIIDKQVYTTKIIQTNE